MDFKVGVFDSGIGGLSILSELEKVLPNEDFYYYGDSLNNPYGEKSDEELFKITSEVVDYLINKGCKLIVIACNTATTRCMKYLREKYQDITFVGTVPAIKVACDREFKNTLVMATPATIESERTSELIRDNKRKDQNIYLVSCPGLARAIEVKDKTQTIDWNNIDRAKKIIKANPNLINFIFVLEKRDATVTDTIQEMIRSPQFQSEPCRIITFISVHDLFLLALSSCNEITIINRTSYYLSLAPAVKPETKKAWLQETSLL